MNNRGIQSFRNTPPGLFFFFFFFKEEGGGGRAKKVKMRKVRRLSETTEIAAQGCCFSERASLLLLAV